MSRLGIQAFQPSRLEEILDTRGLTQADIAASAGVSAPTVSKWMKGTQSPEKEALERLAEYVEVTADWFTRPSRAAFARPLFRSYASARKPARAKLHGRMTWAHEMALLMEEVVDFPPLNLPIRRFGCPEEIRQEDIERAANECRERWKLGTGPIHDLVLAAEGAGIIVVREETGVATIEGLSDWSSELERPFVLLSADKDNAFRSRFDLAHELGHIVLHQHIRIRAAKEEKQEDHELLEQQAHRFAGALLLPAESFVREVRVPPTLNDLLILKRRWGVSASAMIMRLAVLDVISPNEKTALFKRRSARWGSKAEPGDSERPVEKPRLLRRTIEMLAEEGIVPVSAMRQHFGICEADIEALTCLPKGYLSGKAQLLPFVTLKAASLGSSRGAAKVIEFPSRND